MANEIIKFSDVDKLPAHLKALQDTGAEDWGSGQVAGFPVLSLKGKVFHIVRGDEKDLITRPDDDDEPATSLQLVVIKTHKGVARTYYEDQYEEGSNEAPDCYSNDGITPAPDAENKQAKSCAVCPNSQWGSRITENGKKGKACSEVKRLAVAEPGYEDDPMLLRVPPTSLRNWDDYLRKLGKKGMKPTMVVTKVGFDASVSHQLLTFKPVGFVSADMAARIADMQDNDVVEAIIGKGPAVPLPGEVDGDDDGDEGPRERQRASRRDHEEAEERPRRAKRQEESEEDDAPPRRSRRRKAADEDEEKPRRSRRRKAADEDEETPRRSRRAETEEDDEPPSRSRRAKEEEQDELDLDLDEEEEKEQPAGKGAKVVDEDDELAAELDDMLGDLDFDDD